MRFRKATQHLTAALLLGAAPAIASAGIAQPSGVSDLLLWYRADDLIASTAAGGAVNTLTDDSTNGNDATSVSGFVSPTLALTDVPSVSFSATAKDALGAIDTLANAGVGDITIFTLYKTSNTTDSESRPVGFGGSSFDSGVSKNHINLANDPSLRFDGAAITTGYSTSVPNSQYFLRDTTRAGNTFNEYFDGAHVLTNATATLNTVMDDFYLGDLHTDSQPGGGGAANHQIAEVVVYNRALSNTERQSVESYFKAKYESAAYFRFEEGADGATLSTAGGALDYTVHTNNGTGSGGVTFSADTPNAVVPLTGSANNRSAHFDRASHQYINVANDSSISFGDSSFTIEANVKFDTAPGTSFATRQYLLWKKAITGVSDTKMDYGIVFAETGGYGAAAPGELVFVQGNGSAVNFIDSGLTLTDTTMWHSVSVAFDAAHNLVRFILDGQIVTVADNFTAAANSDPLIIGAQFSGTAAVNSFNGSIDELRITGSYLQRSELLAATIPAPAALSAGLMLLSAAGFRRRRRTPGQRPGAK